MRRSSIPVALLLIALACKASAAAIHVDAAVTVEAGPGPNLAGAVASAAQLAQTKAAAAASVAAAAEKAVEAKVGAALQTGAAAAAAAGRIASSAAGAAEAAVGAHAAAALAVAAAAVKADAAAKKAVVGTAAAVAAAVEDAAHAQAAAALSAAKAAKDLAAGAAASALKAASTATKAAVDAADAAKKLAAGVASKVVKSKVDEAAAVAAAAAQVHAAGTELVTAKVGQAAAVVGAAAEADAAVKRFALDSAVAAANAAANATAKAAAAALEAAQRASQAVAGRAYDLADDFLVRPMTPAPANFAAGSCTGSGYCYPAYVSPDVALPRPSCPAGYSLSPVGVCTKKVQVATKTCFVGPVCMAPFNQTGNATCWDDKVMQLITGLLALKRAGAALPLAVAPALAEFGSASASSAMHLAQQSLELHVGAAMKAAGVGANLLGKDGYELVNIGSRLMAFDWPSLPNLDKVCVSVAKAVAQLPQSVLSEAKKAAPKCVRKCCKPDVATKVSAAAPSLSCPEGKGLDLVGLKCVGNTTAGYAPCPAGMRACALLEWHRPLCAVEGGVFGVDSCVALGVLSLAHKLPKVACPAA